MLTASPPATVRSDYQSPAHPPAVEEPIHSHLRLAGPAATDPLSPERLLLAFADQHTAGNYAGAELLAGDLIAAIPDHPEGYYNLACALARQRKVSESLDALDAAVDHGWRRIHHTQVDPDLEPLRDNHRFTDLIERMRTLQTAEAVEPQPLREVPAATIIAELDGSVPELLTRYHVPGVIIAYIEDGTPAWVNAFGQALTDSDDVPISAGSRLALQRPVQMLALMAAARESSRENLNLARLFGEADRIGLRGERADRRGTRLAGAPPPPQRTTRLAALPSPIEQTDPSASDFPVDWRDRGTVPGTLELLTLGIELTSEQSFDAYCAEAIFEPAGMEQSVFARPARRNGPPTSSSNPPAPSLVGHTRFGTPIGAEGDNRGLVLETTIDDLARLLCATMNSDSSLSGEQIQDAIRQGNASPLGLGLSIDTPRSGVRGIGRGLQFAELLHGRGVLARWFPDAGRGIIVVFNSENGPDVAIRIVNQALGGQ